MANFAMPARTDAPPADRRLVAAGTIRHLAGRTITVRATQAGVTGTIRPAALGEPAVATVFDSYGSTWGHATVDEIRQDIAAAVAAGATVHEWHITDRAGQRLHIARIPDPDFLDTIAVTAEPPAVAR
ncbi:hypothetical protein [Streptomyces youssoufiensis]